MVHLGICVDLVLQEVDGKKKGYQEIQEKLEKYLETKLSSGGDYTYHGRTWVAIQFTYEQLEVDLLISPYWKTWEEYHFAMEQVDQPSDRFNW